MTATKTIVRCSCGTKDEPVIVPQHRGAIGQCFYTGRLLHVCSQKCDPGLQDFDEQLHKDHIVTVEEVKQDGE